MNCWTRKFGAHFLVSIKFRCRPSLFSHPHFHLPLPHSPLFPNSLTSHPFPLSPTLSLYLPPFLFTSHHFSLPPALSLYLPPPSILPSFPLSLPFSLWMLAPCNNGLNKQEVFCNFFRLNVTSMIIMASRIIYSYTSCTVKSLHPSF